MVSSARATTPLFSGSRMSDCSNLWRRERERERGRREGREREGDREIVVV